MKLPRWLRRDKPGTIITIEVEVVNLRDLERLTKAAESLERHLRSAAEASEVLKVNLDRVHLPPARKFG